jgi:hypothetical protein
LGLAMQIVEIERIIGGELITVFFTAADRIDSRCHATHPWFASCRGCRSRGPRCSGSHPLWSS